MRLTAAMIVRDEEAVLGRCLSSIAELVDDIVVVDTGSTDATVDIARAHGARVHHRAWDDDFAAARNHGLDRIDTDWILYIDADEYLVEGDREVLERTWAAHPEAILLEPLLCSHPALTPYRERRLWRHHDEVRFVGRIHEEVASSLHAQINRGEGTFGPVDLRLAHSGHETGQEDKARRRRHLLLAELERLPDRLYLWFDLGRTNLLLGDREAALAAWRSGVAAAAKGGPHAYTSLCHFNLVVCRADEGVSEDEVIAQADALFGDDTMMDVAALIAAGVRQDVEEVERRATRLLAADADRMAQIGNAIDARWLGEWARAARARARLAGDDPDGALEDLDQLVRTTPTLEYRVLRQSALMLRERVARSS